MSEDLQIATLQIAEIEAAMAALPKEEVRSIAQSALNYFRGKVKAASGKPKIHKTRKPFTELDVVTAKCPQCSHEFPPIFTEKSSRGPMWPSKSVRWALEQVSGKTAVDFGCGKFRNTELIRQKFDQVICVDTLAQVNRLKHHTPEGVSLVSTEEFSSANGEADVIFLIAVLHVLPSRTRQEIAALCASKAPVVVVDVPFGCNYYAGTRYAWDDGWLLSGNTFYKHDIRQADIDRLFPSMRCVNSMGSRQNHVRIYARQ